MAGSERVRSGSNGRELVLVGVSLELLGSIAIERDFLDLRESMTGNTAKSGTGVEVDA